MIWRALLVCSIIFGWMECLQAQTLTSRLGRFEVNDIKGCAPFTVNVTILAPFVCDGANPCDMDFEGNNMFRSLTFTYTYTQPGQYLLKILFQTSGIDDIPIEVTPNILPSFDVYSCVNNGVSVKVNDSDYDRYVINYNDGSPEVVFNPAGANNYTYASSTPQTITVRGRNLNADDNCNSASQPITPRLTLPPPTISLLQVLDNARIRMEFDGQPNILYKLEVATNNATVFQQLKTLYNKTTDTLLNLRTDDNYYCLRLSAFDPCNNTVINSAIICSANFDLSVRNNAIDLTWATTSAGVSNFRLTRNASDGAVLVTSPPGSPFSDVGITCGIAYCYQLITNYPNGSQSISLTKCGTGLSSDIPSPINNITALVGQTSLNLEWNPVGRFIPAEFSIEKSIQGTYNFLSSTPLFTLSDPEYKTEQASCYKISYKDVCGNQSPVSLEACPVRLTGNLAKDNSINLSWTPYLGWTQGVSGYVVEKYAEGGQLLQTFQAGKSTTFSDDSNDFNYQTFLYVVKAIAVEAGLGQAVSNKISILKDPNIFHPTAFTPNGDNLNDIFNVYGQYVVDFEMNIFNRWGELLYTTTKLEEGWDGTFRGNTMPEGTYTFIASIKDRAGRTFIRSGSVLLLRK